MSTSIALLPSRWRAVLVLVVALMLLQRPPESGAMAPAFEVTLATDRATYQRGEPIAMTLRLTSGTETVRLQFPTSQRFDFALRDARGAQVWRWSEGRMFGQMVGSETLGPARPQNTYQAEFQGDLAPGWYQLEGAIVAKDGRASATLPIEIR